MGVFRKSPSSNDDQTMTNAEKEKASLITAERALVLKLDIFIMAYCCLSYFFNYLDRKAFNNAYAGGLKESLNFQGNEYSTLLALYTAGNCVGQIPHGLIIQKIRPSIWLPATLIMWSLLTMACALCKTYAALAVVRFIQGFMEASLYSGTIFVMGCWYKPLEIAKRTSIFTAVGQIGSISAGLMMTAMNATMEGHGGLQGWQWLFVLNGLIGIPIGILGLFVFPDMPENTKVFYLSSEEIELVKSRLPPKTIDSNKIEWRSLSRRLLRYKPLYVLTIFSIVCAMLEAFVVQDMFLIWMKKNASQFSTYAITTYPVGVQAVAIFANIGAGYYIDMTDTRLPMGFLAVFLQLITSIILVIPNIPTGATFFAYYNSGTSYIVNPLSYGWASVILRRDGDDVSRAVVLYTMNLGSQILYTFWGIVLYPASDAPYWKNGAIAMIVACFAYCACLLWVRDLDMESRKRHANVQSIEQTGSAETIEDVTESKSNLFIVNEKQVQEKSS